MATFADYVFYKQHGGALSETEYTANVDDAHAEILSQTLGRANNAPVEMQEAVKLCECVLVDVIAAYGQTDSILPKGVNSVNNDALSVSMGSSGATLLQSRSDECAAVCARYLQWPINLMCRWI